MTTKVEYTIVSRWGKGQRVVVYVATGWESRVKVAYQEGRMVILELRDKIIAGIYGDSKATRKNYRRWMKELRGRIGRREGVVMGDWNAHHK